MQAIDRTAIDTLGIPRLLLMDHAGLAVFRAVRRLAPNPTACVAVCCGTGFNGGDGLATARHLHRAGYALHVLVAGRVERLREEPATFARILQRLGVELYECLTAEDAEAAGPRLDESAVLIDALLGIGTEGAVREPIASLIERMNRAGKPIVAADIPSGLDGDTGRVHGGAVRATVTVTFGLPKRGCLIAEGPAHTGKLVVDPITMPRSLLVP